MRKVLFSIAALAVITTPVNADELAAPTGGVVLTVSGAIETTNAEGVALFDLAMLDALDNRTTVTETPWYEGPQSFSGPLGTSLLEAVGATGTMMKVTAVNDYSAEVPVADFAESPVVLATRMNDKVLSVRDKGPVFLIYPFDEHPDLYNELYFSRSVWQVVAIEIY